MGTYAGGRPGGPDINPGLMADQILDKANKAEVKKKQPSAEALADKALSRDQMFQKLYGMVPAMERYAESRLGNHKADAADIVSKAMAYVVQSIDNGVFRFDTSLNSWFKISINGRILDRFRSAANDPLDRAESMDAPKETAKGDDIYRQYADSSLNAEENLVAQSDTTVLKKGIGVLLRENPRLGEVMSLVADGLTNQEIAERLKLNSKQVKDLKFKGTEALQNILRSSGEEEKLAA